jgi:hypothetical protein
MLENTGLIAVMETVFATLHSGRGNAILPALNDRWKRKLFGHSIHSISDHGEGINLESNEMSHYTMAPGLF